MNYSSLDVYYSPDIHRIITGYVMDMEAYDKHRACMKRVSLQLRCFHYLRFEDPTVDIAMAFFIQGNVPRIQCVNAMLIYVPRLTEQMYRSLECIRKTIQSFYRMPVQINITPESSPEPYLDF